MAGSSDELRDYQVLGVRQAPQGAGGGALYRVRHRRSGQNYLWKPVDCSTLGLEPQQLRTALERDARAVRRLRVPELLRYHHSVVHAPSHTLYLVLENCAAPTLRELAAAGRLCEPLVWRVLLRIAHLCKLLESTQLEAFRVRFSPDCIFVEEGGALRVDCFEPAAAADVQKDPVEQLGDTVREVCSAPCASYGDELQDVLRLLADERLRPDVLLYHPAVLANSEGASAKRLTVATRAAPSSPASPVYVNVERLDVSPDLRALALELPGFVPRERRAPSPQRVSQCTLSHQWMSRLVALRQREEALNVREKKLIAREIVDSPSPSVDIVALDDRAPANGITLPPVVAAKGGAPRPARRRRALSARAGVRRPLCAYEDLDSSLSADAGDDEVPRTAAKLPSTLVPRRDIFRRLSAKRVQFASADPFVESDESVTLTFYELEGVAVDEAAGPARYKYLEAGERPGPRPRAGLASPAKRTRLADITNKASGGGGGPMHPPPAKPVHGNVNKSKGRKSLLSFMTPFKFISSTKV